MIKAKPEALNSSAKPIFSTANSHSTSNPHTYTTAALCPSLVFTHGVKLHILLDGMELPTFKMLEEIKFQLDRGLKHFQTELTSFSKHRSRECGSTRGGNAPSNDGQSSCRVFWMPMLLQPGRKIVSHDFPGLFNSQKGLKINIDKQVPVVIIHVLQWKPPSCSHQTELMSLLDRSYKPSD